MKKTAKQWIRFAADEVAVSKGYYFAPKRADHIVDFAETYLPAPGGMNGGRPLKLLPYQRDILQRLNGWRNPQGGRRFNKFLFSSAKQNFKSLCGKIVSMYFLMADDAPRPVVWCACTTEIEAKNFYADMEYWCKHVDSIRECVNPVPSKSIIEYPEKDGRFEILSSVPVRGVGVTCCVLDEMAFHLSDKVFSAVKFSGRAQRNPLLCMLSTTSRDRTCRFHEQWLHGQKLLSGENTEDLNYLPVIYTADEEDDLYSLDTWKKANPSYPEQQNPQEVSQAIALAKTSKREEIDHKNLNLNQWAQDSDTFLNLDKWEACATRPWPDLRGKQCWIGCDFASFRDLFAVAVVVPVEDVFYLFGQCWTNKAAAERRVKQNLTRYTEFVEEGSLIIEPGDETGTAGPKEFVAQLCDQYKVVEISCDRTQAKETMELWDKMRLKVTQFPQTHSYYTSPMKRLDALVNNGKLRHNGAKMWAWQGQNLKVHEDKKQMLLPVKATESQKIDLMCASLMALNGASIASAGPAKTAYATRGIVWV